MNSHRGAMSIQAAMPQTKVKICGITRLEDARAAAEAGADYLGYVVYEGSKRHITAPAAGAIVRAIRAEHPAIRHVAVVVRPTAAEAADIVGEAGVDLIQFHGGEAPELLVEFRAARAGAGIIKAIGVTAEGPAADWLAFDADFILFDTYHATDHGGTGVKFDHGLLPANAQRGRMFLAGGLTPENVGDVVAQIEPYAVDVSSAVETSPGIKSPPLMQAFLRAAKFGQGREVG